MAQWVLLSVTDFALGLWLLGAGLQPPEILPTLCTDLSLSHNAIQISKPISVISTFKFPGKQDPDSAHLCSILQDQIEWNVNGKVNYVVCLGSPSSSSSRLKSKDCKPANSAVIIKTKGF